MPHLNRVHSTTLLTRPTGTDPQPTASARPGQHSTASSRVVYLHCKEPQNEDCDSTQNSQTLERKPLHTECLEELISLLHWLTEDLVTCPQPSSLHEFLADSPMKPLIYPSTSATLQQLLKEFLVHLSHAVAIIIYLFLGLSVLGTGFRGV